MRKKLQVLPIILSFFIAFTFKSYAQVSVGLQAGLAHADRGNVKNLANAGLNLRIHVSPHLAFGAAAKVYGGGKDYGTGTDKYDLVNVTIPLTGTVDYYLSTGAVRPYIGADAGVYISKYQAEQNKNTIYESPTYKNFGAAPRAGIIFALGNVGLQLEGIYHLTFKNNDHLLTTGNLSNVNFKSSSRVLGINVGLIIGLGRKK